MRITNFIPRSQSEALNLVVMVLAFIGVYGVWGWQGVIACLLAGSAIFAAAYWWIVVRHRS